MPLHGQRLTRPTTTSPTRSPSTATPEPKEIRLETEALITSDKEDDDEEEEEEEDDDDDSPTRLEVEDESDSSEDADDRCSSGKFGAYHSRERAKESEYQQEEEEEELEDEELEDEELEDEELPDDSQLGYVNFGDQATFSKQQLEKEEVNRNYNEYEDSVRGLKEPPEPSLNPEDNLADVRELMHEYFNNREAKQALIDETERHTSRLDGIASQFGLPKEKVYLWARYSKVRHPPKALKVRKRKIDPWQVYNKEYLYQHHDIERPTKYDLHHQQHSTLVKEYWDEEPEDVKIAMKKRAAEINKSPYAFLSYAEYKLKVKKKFLTDFQDMCRVFDTLGLEILMFLSDTMDPAGCYVNGTSTGLAYEEFLSGKDRGFGARGFHDFVRGKSILQRIEVIDKLDQEGCLGEVMALLNRKIRLRKRKEEAIARGEDPKYIIEEDPYEKPKGHRKHQSKFRDRYGKTKRGSKRQAAAAVTASATTTGADSEARTRQGDGDQSAGEGEEEEQEQGRETRQAKRKTPHRDDEEDSEEEEEEAPRPPKKRSKSAATELASSQKRRDNIRSDIKERLIAIYEEAIPPESDGIKRKNFPSKKEIGKAFLKHHKRWELSDGITEEDVVDLKLRRSKEGMKKLKDALDGNHIRIVDAEAEEGEEGE
ncbi:hypothetical protein BJ508DRAFT_327574 [Ascobolus immersus RN42]|uniref:Uncharacterized protein n=1 Tax=Ascobolus immersus RN42 TaxID=1160509 RepID=A0A3N4I4F1_ASCIM|nr:hypothetical protein BJ508DRAFT_327574 [Ascobolus immersus RN42]